MRSRLLDVKDTSLTPVGVALKSVLGRMSQLSRHLRARDMGLLSEKIPVTLSSELIDALPTNLFPPGVQADASELARYLFQYSDVVEDEGLMTAMYGGRFCESIECLHCGHRSFKKVPFFDLNIPLNAMNEAKFPVSGGGLQESINGLFRGEMLRGSNRYSCSTCGKKRKAWKSMAIVKSPKYLMISINRFSWDAETQMQRKECAPIHVPASLTLEIISRPQVSCQGEKDQNGNVLKSAIYVLNSIILHKGIAANSGHYVTLSAVQSIDSETAQRTLVYSADDSNIHYLTPPDSSSGAIKSAGTKECLEAPFSSLLLAKQIVSETAATPYVIFYQRSSLSNKSISHAP